MTQGCPALKAALLSGPPCDLIEAGFERIARRLRVGDQTDPACERKRVFLPGPFIVHEKRAGVGLAFSAQDISTAITPDVRPRAPRRPIAPGAVAIVADAKVTIAADDESAEVIQIVRLYDQTDSALGRIERNARLQDKSRRLDRAQRQGNRVRRGLQHQSIGFHAARSDCPSFIDASRREGRLKCLTLSGDEQRDDHYRTGHDKKPGNRRAPRKKADLFGSVS